MTDSHRYVGSELELFAQARGWKGYVASRVTPHLGPRVLEVGAGLGGTTRVLCDGSQEEWICLEPDPELAAALRAGPLPACCTVRIGTTEDLEPRPTFDNVLYMDVLEHVEDDRGELQRAARLLVPGGRLVVLAPAHPWLFSPFDESVGHFRRYTRGSLAAVVPGSMECVELVYLDAAGVLASLANRAFLRSPLPTQAQIRFWDRVLVPLSRRLDPLLFHRVGKSVLGIWRRKG
ncbi:MAG TPA: class I SAM-dependent methyltransferase [Longimicrobiaceae bacterium]|nr:class I SAM-dependent methyltransferase [Longimicrobiaceae bacterium]